MTFEKWFTTFIEEKGLEDQLFEIEHDGMLHLIDMEFLMEFFFKLRKEEKEQIKKNLVKIDFLNGDILHFLHYCAEGYIKEVYTA